MKRIVIISTLLGLAAQLYAAEWTVIFNGKSTDKLRAYGQQSFPSDIWVIDGDALKTIPGKSLDFMTKDKFADFELEFEWKVSPGANSGVMYRVAESDKEPAWYTGPEMQILDDAKHADGKNPKTTAGSLYALIAPNSEKKLKPVGEFNTAKIRFKSNHVEHWLNGAKVVEYEWGSPDVKALIAESKFASMPKFMAESSGHIVFQHHGDEVWYRNIRVRKL